MTPLSIGPIVCDPPVVLAPMAGVTNAPFRRLCRSFGGALYVSEMVSARGLVEGSERTAMLASFDDDEPTRSIQLYGADASVMAQAVRQLVDADHVDHIDLNFGCPVRKVTRHGGGAALPARPDLFEAVVGAAVRAAGPIPVTVKMRIGLDDSTITAMTAGRIAEAVGVAAVALHARTAEQAYSGSARWDAITELKSVVTSVPVLGNGDIWDPDDALAMIRETGCDGVVIGRGCLGRPWLFRDLAAVFAGMPRPQPPTLGEVCDMLRRHADELIAFHRNGRESASDARDQGGEPSEPTETARERKAMVELRKHTGWYLQGFAIGHEVRKALHQISTRDELERLLDPFDPAVPFPVEVLRAPHGHMHGPKPVTIPDGWLDPNRSFDLDPDAELALSGG